MSVKKTHKEDSKHVGLRITKELHKKLSDAAWSMRLTVQEFCIDAIVRHIAFVTKKINGNGKKSEAPVVRDVLNQLREQPKKKST